MAKVAEAVNEFEVIVFRCDNPKNGRFGYNGYLKARVFKGQTSEIPRWHPVRDPERQVQLTDEHGTLRWRENKTPGWGEFIAYEDRTPRRPSQVQTEQASGSLKTKPKMRAADSAVGA